MQRPSETLFFRFQTAFFRLFTACRLSRFVFQRQFDMRFGRLGRFFQSKFDLLLFAQQIAPVAFFIPVAAVQLDGVLDAFATVAALQIVFFAVFVATPADTLGIFRENGKFLGHDVLLLFVCGMGRIISDLNGTGGGFIVFYADFLRCVNLSDGLYCKNYPYAVQQEEPI